MKVAIVTKGEWGNLYTRKDNRSRAGIPINRLYLVKLFLKSIISPCSITLSGTLTPNRIFLLVVLGVIICIIKIIKSTKALVKANKNLSVTMLTT